MLKDFVLNGTILISVFSIFGSLQKKHHFNQHSPFRIKFIWGILFGLLGVLLMFYSIKIDANTIADLRHLATVFAAAMGGMLPALISAFVISVGRILLFGVSQSSLVAAILMIVIGISCGLMSRMKLSFLHRSFWMNIVSLLIISSSFYINIKDDEKLLQIFIFHFTISLIGGLFAFQIIQYYKNSNKNLYKLKISEQNYRQLANQYQSVVNNVKEVIYQTNEKGDWTFLNPSWTEITGFTVVESIGKNYADYVYTSDQGNPKDQYQSFPIEKGHKKYEIRVITKEGGFKWLEVYSRFSYDEHGNLAGTLGTLYDISDRKKMEEELTAASIIDGLTGISNRRHFNDMITQKWKSCLRSKKELSLIMLDIDYFKLYNDTYGHQVGDECIRHVAQTISHVLMRPDDAVFRYGGEEFAVILPETNAEGAEVVANNICLSLADLNLPHHTSKVSSLVTVSIGLATVKPQPAQSYNDLINQADKALYMAKGLGRNCVRHYRDFIELHI
ncbi:diguanylate cyclase domain-containing protein [Cytobacillus sp. FJAT-53684]|uniref:Diguanylate cyclase domain-containing protein n=1 Tax=Cytobacillus mangrovibacter TaxID=3299024 RepID=A0ABW6JVG3_9BACI